MAASNCSVEIFKSFSNKSLPNLASSAMASVKCSTDTNASCNCFARSRALSTAISKCLPKTCCEAPCTFGCLSMYLFVLSITVFMSTPRCFKIFPENPSRCSNRAKNKCSVSTICCDAFCAFSGAATMASQARSVNSDCEIFFCGCSPPPSDTARVTTILPFVFCLAALMRGFRLLFPLPIL